MSESNKFDISLLEFIDRITDSLKHEIEHTHKVVRKYLENNGGNKENINYCCLVDCPAKQTFRQSISKAIKTLESTKRSFKSKELENLRKDLEEVLLEVR